MAVGALKGDSEGNLRKVVTFDCNQNLKFLFKTSTDTYILCVDKFYGPKNEEYFSVAKY